MMSHSDLVHYFKTQYQLTKNKQYQHDVLEEMMIFERDIYASMYIEDKRSQT